MRLKIDSDLCQGCGLCGDICPRHIPEVITAQKKNSIINDERSALCMECGHCVAICPNQAIRLDSFDADGFKRIQFHNIDEDQMLVLLRQRRSVRRYQDIPMPREVIDKILMAADVSPTGSGRMTTGVIVIDNTETLARLSSLTYEAYEKLEKALKNPMARFIIRQKKGKQILGMLQDFVMPGMQWYINWYREGRSNEILRDCPVLLLFHSPIYEPMGSSNCLIAAFHAILMAQVLNIGTCLNSLIPPMCNRVQEIRELLGLPKDREVCASITMGYSKYSFKRVIPRKLAEIRYLE